MNLSRLILVAIVIAFGVAACGEEPQDTSASITNKQTPSINGAWVEAEIDGEAVPSTRAGLWAFNSAGNVFYSGPFFSESGAYELKDTALSLRWYQFAVVGGDSQTLADSVTHAVLTFSDDGSLLLGPTPGAYGYVTHLVRVK